MAVEDIELALKSGYTVVRPPQPVSSADCNTDQTRQKGDPSAKQIRDAIFTDTNGNDLLDSVCAGEFPPGSDHISTFNSGSIIYNITRDDANTPIDKDQCEGAFKNIVKQCITEGDYWGGDWERPGVYFAIYNAQYPKHVLPAELLSSATKAPTATITKAPSGATTISRTIHGTLVTETFVPTSFPSVKRATTSSINIDGVIIPIAIAAGGFAFIPFIPVGGVPPNPDFPNPTKEGNDPDENSVTKTKTKTKSSASKTSSSSSSATGRLGIPPVDYFDPNDEPVQLIINPVALTQVVLTSGEASATTAVATPTKTKAPIVTPSDPPADTGQCQDDCTAIIPQLNVYGDLVCTAGDIKNFVDHGTTSDPNGNADWFRVSSHNDCYLMIAKTAVHRGFADQYCFQKSALITFVNDNALGCNFGDGFNRMSGSQGPQSKFSGSGEVCLTNFKNYKSCGQTDL
ncbi:MAG: ribosomal protein S5, partial [Chaenotheca gracillima]